MEARLPIGPIGVTDALLHDERVTQTTFHRLPGHQSGDPLYTAKFESILRGVGVNLVKLPARSPNLNAHAERFVRSIKEECLNHLILSSEEQLRHVLSEYLEHYRHERIHQGLDRIIEPRRDGNQGEIMGIERLGNLLKSYHREAA